MLSCFSHIQLFVTPWTIARQAPLSTGFSSQEHWSGLPFPPPGDLPSPGKEPTSLMSPALAGGLFTTGFTWEALQIKRMSLIYLPCLPDEKRVLREKQLGEGRGERKARSSSSDERWAYTGSLEGQIHMEGDIGRLFRHRFSALKISFLFFLRAFNFLSLPFPFICQLWVFWFDSRETDSWWSSHCFSNTRLFMFTLSLRRGELVFRKAASCSQSLCFGGWAMVEMNFSEFKVKLVSPQIGERSVPVVKRVHCR